MSVLLRVDPPGLLDEEVRARPRRRAEQGGLVQAGVRLLPSLAAVALVIPGLLRDPEQGG